MEEEAVRADARKLAQDAQFGAPMRFFCMAGETKEIVIIDDEPDFFRHEHALQSRTSKRWDNFVPCIDTHANCPVCAVAERHSYYAMFLTVLDLTPYTPKSGGPDVEFSKKLLVVKSTQQKKIMRLFDKYKTLRGMHLSMTRDTDKDAAIGGDIEFMDFFDEEELVTYVSEYTDKKNKVHVVDCSVPYEYEEIMPDMTEKQLRAVAGGKPEAGSREANGATLRDDPWQDDAAPRRTASRRGAAPQDDEGQDDGQDAAPAPRRGAPARRATASPEDGAPDADLPWNTDEEEGQEEQQAAAPARVARTVRAPAAPLRAAAPTDRSLVRRGVPNGQAPRADDGDEGQGDEGQDEQGQDEQDDPPQRPARVVRGAVAAPRATPPASPAPVSARRASLRR